MRRIPTDTRECRPHSLVPSAQCNLLGQWAEITVFTTAFRTPLYLQGRHQRHLLQAFPAGLDEASILNSALQLQRVTCASTSNCFPGADCVNGICSCRSPYVETSGQVSLPLPSNCHGAAGVSTLHWSGCLSGEQLLPCTVDYASVLQVACLHAAAPGLLPSGHGTFALDKPRPLGLIKGPEGSRGCLITPCAMCSARTSATPAVRSCAMAAVTAPLQHNSVRAAAAALCASMVESVRPPKMKLAGGQS